MQITFDGAAGEVTGPMHLLEVNGQRILLDCGLYQGRRADTYERNLNFPWEPASIDCVVLSHAHIDLLTTDYCSSPFPGRSTRIHRLSTPRSTI